MKQTFSFFSKRNALWCFLLTGFVFLVGMNLTNAQSSLMGTDNPQFSIAQTFNVTAYPLGTFDRDQVIVVLEGIAVQIKSIAHPSNAQLLKMQYLSKLMTDVQSQYIATEISLLTSLKSLSENPKAVVQSNHQTFGGNPAPITQFTALYNEVVSELQ